jgi:hypothetical protein
MKRNFLQALILLLSAVVVRTNPSYGANEQKMRYSYHLLEGQVSVCEHMNEVFNRSFSDLWNADPLWSESDVHYAANSRYAFPMLPGVDHSARDTFTMRFSKTPSSAEFNSVAWREGRALIGVSTKPEPILIAYLDFDNDGQLDTVIKVGFSGGYKYMTYGGDLFAEHILVLRGRQMELKGVLPLNTLTKDVPFALAPVIATATYERPFIYQAHTYVAQYDEDLGEGFAAAKKPLYKPIRETMSILSYRFTGRAEANTNAPEWDVDTVCRFEMSQIAASKGES